MKKLAIISLLAVCGSVFASGPKTPKTISCAVMPSNKVDVAKATKNHMYADYKGRRYFFCCAGCPQDFKKDPAKYAKSASIAIPKK
jgi:YHS domain-containing protein